MNDRIDEIKTKWNFDVTLPMAAPWGKDDVVWLVGEVERLRADAHHAQALRAALCVARAALVDPIRLKTLANNNTSEDHHARVPALPDAALRAEVAALRAKRGTVVTEWTEERRPCRRCARAIQGEK